jgi:hypothetical protein
MVSHGSCVTVGPWSMDHIEVDQVAQLDDNQVI